MAKTVSENKLGSRKMQRTQYLGVPASLRETGFEYAWARYSQVTGDDMNLLPDGWTPVRKKGATKENPAAESEYKGLGSLVRHGDVVLVKIKTEDYDRNRVAKTEKVKRLKQGVRMRSHKVDGVRVKSEFKEERTETL